MKSLTIWDIDDTLLKTKNKVFLNTVTGEKKELTSHEFATYELQDGETYDWSDFRNALKFFVTAQPIKPIIRLAKKMMSKLKHEHQEFILLTARGALNDHDMFKRTFKLHGFDIDRTPVYYAGDRGKRAAIGKKEIIRELLSEKHYDMVRMFDDAAINIRLFKELQREFPNTKFEAFLVENHGVRRI